MTGDVRSESEKVGGFKREVGGVAEEERERESFGKFEKARKGLVWRFEDFLEMVFMSDIFFAAEEKVEEGAWEKER